MISSPAFLQALDPALGAGPCRVQGGLGRPVYRPSSALVCRCLQVRVMSVAHRRNPPLGTFPTQPSGVNFVATITTMQRGRSKCANSLSFLSSSCHSLAACRTPIRAALAARLQGLSQLMRWTKIWSLARLLAPLLALQPAASTLACRLAAHATKLSVAFARPNPALETTCGDSPAGGFFVSARAKPRDPEEVTCSRRS